MISRIYLIRHGLTEGNLKHWYYGSTDIPLTEEGYDTIKSYAVQGIYPEIPNDADIYTTGLVRTEQTLEAIYGDRDHSVLSKLQEIDFRSAECMTYDELKKFDNFDAWAWDQTGNIRIADAETSNEFHERIREGTDELLDKHRLREWSHRHGGEDAISVLVCHGGVISCMMEYMFPAVCGSMWDWLPEPGFGYAIDLEDGKPFMYSKINDIGRLGLGLARVPSDEKALSAMIEPYLKGGHGYFELYYNKDRTLHGDENVGMTEMASCGDSENRKSSKRVAKVETAREECHDSGKVKTTGDDCYGSIKVRTTGEECHDSGKVEAAADPSQFSKTIKAVLIDRYPRNSFKLACSLDIDDVDKIKGYLDALGAGFFDRVSVWGAEKYYLSSDSEPEALNAAFEKLDAIKQEGLTGKVGLGFFGDPDVLDRLLKEQAAIDYVELPVNYQSGYGNGERSQKYYTISRRRYKEILVTGPFDGGRLAREMPNGADMSTIEDYSVASQNSPSSRSANVKPDHVVNKQNVSDKRDTAPSSKSMAKYAMLKSEQAPKTPVEWALRYVLSLPFVTICIATTSCAGHAVMNLEAANDFRPLTEDQQAQLKDAASKHRTPEYREIKALFEQNQDEEIASGMAHYMRDMFTFYGIKTPERRKIYRDFLKKEKKLRSINWAFLDDCYSDLHREFQYLACDYLLTMKDALAFDDLEHIRRYIETRPWWDTIDFLCKAAGDIGLRDSRVDGLMLEWAEDDDMWVRRTAIEHQLGRKTDTDKRLLSRIIKMNLESKEFFIIKAIGWALRDYSKTDPEWVKKFIDKNRDKLSSLSIREGSKYI